MIHLDSIALDFELCAGRITFKVWECTRNIEEQDYTSYYFGIPISEDVSDGGYFDTDFYCRSVLTKPLCLTEFCELLQKYFP